MNNSFGEYLKDLRLDRKLTLREVEDRVQISNAYLSQVECGKRGAPTMKVLAKLANIYGVPVALLNEKAAEHLPEAMLLEKMKLGNKCPNPFTSNKNGIPVDAINAKEWETELAKPLLPSPDAKFILRGYEKLSENRKKSLKDFLQYLLNEDKGKK